MKYLLCLCLLLVGVSASAQETDGAYATPSTTAKMPKVPAGQESPVVFKGANTILIRTTDSSAVALKKMARLMIVEGYTMDKLDAELGYLQTTGKPAGFVTPATYTYKIVSMPDVGGTLLKITGSCTYPYNLRQDIVMPMMQASGHMLQCFTAMRKTAEKYPSAAISYISEGKSRPIISTK